MDENSLPMHFIDAAVSVTYESPPLILKKPRCPDALTWEGSTFRVKAILAEWCDYQRRGRMARNMQPAHAQTASLRGSWGVGRFYFRVETDCGRIFDLYYDRAPKDACDREGQWFLLGERGNTAAL